MPYVNHVLPNFQCAVDPVGTHLIVQINRIVEQHFITAHMNQKRRQPV